MTNARTAALAAATLLGLFAQASALPAQTVAWVGATVWDGTGRPPLGGATLLVRDGRVVSLDAGPPPAGVRVEDVSGRWIIPGLVDAHAHVTGAWAPADASGDAARVEAELLLFARYGVTTVNSLGGEPAAAFAARDRSEVATPGRARLTVAGPVIGAATADDARAAVEGNAEAGVDWIKIRVDDNLGTTSKMPWAAVSAVLDAAHARGLRVATHLFYADDARRLLEEGTDMVAHSVRDRDLDPATLELLGARDVCTVPTLTREVSAFVYAERPDFFEDPFFLRLADRGEMARLTAPAFQASMAASPAAARYREALAQAQRNLKILVDAGLPVAFGTDAGPPGRFPGYFEHMELALMADAGLTPAQALHAATGGAAACLGRADVGTLEPGRWADFLVLEADPLSDVTNLRALAAVYVGGRPIG